MPISRPSRVGEAPRYRPDPEEEAERRRREHLDRVRKQSHEARRQRRDERVERERAAFDRSLNLSRRQGSLVHAIDRESLTLPAAVEAVYGVKWSRLSKRRQRRFLGRLRTLQYATNQKFKERNYCLRASATRGKICLVRVEVWKNRPVWRRDRRRERREQRGVARCADFILSLFRRRKQPVVRDGCLDVTTLIRLASAEGFRPGTIRAARRRLGLVPQRVGYGGAGRWVVRPPRNEAKPDKSP